MQPLSARPDADINIIPTTVPSPGPDKPTGPYPTVVKSKNGNQVLVVQASALSKYLGNLSIVYKDSGEILSSSGNPIFLAGNLATGLRIVCRLIDLRLKFFLDANIDKELNIWKESIDIEGKKILGKALHTIDNRPCKFRECVLGNFATDAMVDWVCGSFKKYILIICHFTSSIEIFRRVRILVLS